jgi:hypothetical protein
VLSAFGRILGCLILLGWVGSVSSFAQEAATQPGTADSQDVEDWGGLTPGKGREETFSLCVACHSMRLVTQQGLSRERWDEVIDWMVAKQAMPAPAANDRKLIVDYLARHYGPKRKRRRFLYPPLPPADPAQ